MSRVYSLKAVQKIPAGIEDVWAFFSNPGNLKDITPGHLAFKVTSKHHGNHIYAGQVIEYKVSPLLGIPLYWMTEITHVNHLQFFADEQRYGPYSLWHHQHHFKPVAGGVEMTDIVHYKIPFWVIGDMANTLFVRAQLKKIFIYRYAVVEKLFGSWPGEVSNIEF
ncbi:SRPBCC family protein [Foetidibacter luteolus]|uniref:SRPBCC family protein n=1 Tax=Foetidibacter luteolus TaxID=2608880 RepID=UPI00129BA280|nr:SRPBCC family protein [Foetidibacter luteolus]